MMSYVVSCDITSCDCVILSYSAGLDNAPDPEEFAFGDWKGESVQSDCCNIYVHKYV